ncbi:MAG: C2H2-type zinc finger protein, partial [Thermoplasmata archaeon]
DCGRIFRSEDALAAHREESHSGLEAPRSVSPALSSVTCASCGRTFGSSDDLRRHRWSAHRAA